MAWLAEMGFDVVEHCMVTAETVAAAVEEFRDKIEQNDIASDGLVLTFDSIAYSQSLGRTAKFPQGFHCLQMGGRNGGNHSATD